MKSERCDVILVQPNIVSPYKIYNLPFGPLFLASALKKNGFKVKIFDDRFDDRKDLEEIIRKNNLLYIGMTVFTGPIIRGALELCKFIKNVDSSVPIVWGGPHPSILPEQTIAHPLVDMVFRGEGESASVELAKALKKGEGLERIRGLTFERGGNILSNPERTEINEWDRDVSMSLDLIDLNRYIFDYNGMKSLHIITSKGCPFRCSFCWNLLCTKKVYRAWSIRKMKKELSPILDAGVKNVILNDAFMGTPRRVTEMAHFFKDNGLAWSIEDGFRVDVHGTNEGLFKILKETGCHHASFGAESGSQRMLDILKKDIKVEQIVNSARIAHKNGIGVKYSWMIGMPHETKKDALMTVRIIDKINRLAPGTAHSMSFFSPYPGSELYQYALKHGWEAPKRLEDWSYFREEMKYPYLRDMWFYKSVMYSNFFIHATNSENAIWKQTKPLYTCLLKLLCRTSTIRWKTRGFDLPIEYFVGEALRKRAKNWLE